MRNKAPTSILYSVIKHPLIKSKKPINEADLLTCLQQYPNAPKSEAMFFFILNTTHTTLRQKLSYQGQRTQEDHQKRRIELKQLDPKDLKFKTYVLLMPDRILSISGQGFVETPGHDLYSIIRATGGKMEAAFRIDTQHSIRLPFGSPSHTTPTAPRAETLQMQAHVALLSLATLNVPVGRSMMLPPIHKLSAWPSTPIPHGAGLVFLVQVPAPPAIADVLLHGILSTARTRITGIAVGRVCDGEVAARHAVRPVPNRGVPGLPAAQYHAYPEVFLRMEDGPVAQGRNPNIVITPCTMDPKPQTEQDSDTVEWVHSRLLTAFMVLTEQLRPVLESSRASK
eukprot:gnl/Dysnectes_brevis/5876_a8734_376.p1 GENE.gnl/Dysnectes_brevis/5876_a8734_376~~gnl/Dysnectes_brevis/5876_a8734_376.p1  ORF type:complete len:354 (-),score=36.25 gnl/Dysnectes_brevis/5876_a8734_376:66-1085(-)